MRREQQKYVKMEVIMMYNKRANITAKINEWIFGEAEAVGVVEVILILVVLIALVIIFQDQLTQLVNNIFESIRNKAGTIY